MPDTAHLTDAQREQLAKLLTEVRSLTARNQVEQAIEKLIHFDSGIDPQDELIRLSQRWQDNERQYQSNLIRREDYLLTQSQGVHALLAFVGDLKQAVGTSDGGEKGAAAADRAGRSESVPTDDGDSTLMQPDRVITTSPAAAPLIFLLYHPEDASTVLRFVGHLRLLVRAQKIRLYDVEKDPELGDREADISRHLQQARLVLCCITTNFMDRPYELATRAHKRGIPLAPILLEPTDLEFSIFENMVCLPRSSGPVSGWANTDAAYKHVVEEIKRFFGL